ncbi:ubiquitin carboxyl-terminal hydrolase 20-like [Amphibalanus amphitrite]|uniref:ubiquitin carboxyl-terminal hydrolase 20-like n=1 Tax=Amphibalanus amphitrite TaxID=1232801 RepID=UPI001C919A9D|nr:ubiquitin carboxyl-terminal hydrolase 20-like [Amphibalanus amphitrite]XP_043229021.1 ubiquitin carboxyl-terminal hydrolase 20-like [Amphibalanus amphitrite]XP_043229022.1 ubiquitin carboxyl-terminal hydrolase 20-like [Amphibalanus amphitrite]
MSKQPLSAPCRSRCAHVTSIGSELTPTDVEARRRSGACDWCGRQQPNLWLCLHAGCAKLGCGDREDHSAEHHRQLPHHCLALNVTTMRVWCYNCQTEVYLENNVPPVSGAGAPVAVDQVDVADVGSSEDDDEQSDAEPPCGLTGLRNIGNTCYMNAALQALSNLPPLTRYFLDCERLVPTDRKPGLARAYLRLVQQIWSRRRVSCLAPTAVLQAMRSAHPQFRGFQQHDSQEFLRCFMDVLHDELRRPAAWRPEDDAERLTEPDGGDASASDSALSDAETDGDYETADSGVSERSSDSESAAPRRRRRRHVYTQRSAPLPAADDMEFADAESAPLLPAEPSAPPSPARSASPAVGAPRPGRRLRYRSIVSDVFDGRILSSVQCLTCNGVSATRETFQDLSLAIPSREHLSVLHAQPAGGRGAACVQLNARQAWGPWLWSWLASWFSGPSVSLHDCLASFFSSDELKGDNMYSCGGCKKLRNGLKVCRVLELPEVLTIHLKRFRHELVFSTKLGTQVEFPLVGLDMAPYLHRQSRGQVTVYDLAAVVCHHGTAGAGHYTAYALNEPSGAWYEYDDQYVTEVGADTVQSCQAYVLFYRKSCEASNQRRQRATELLRRARADPSLLPYYVSRQWISRFNTFAEPGAIDNTDFLCRHGGLLPELAVPAEAACARLPQAGWEYLHAALGGGPVANALFECAPCRAEWDALLARRARELTEFRRLQASGAPPAAALSAAWYRRWEAWARGRDVEPPGTIDNSNIAVTRAGVPQVRSGSDHVQLPAELWAYLKAIYGGGPDLPLVPPPAVRHEHPEPSRAQEPSESAIAGVHRRVKAPAVHCGDAPSEDG